MKKDLLMKIIVTVVAAILLVVAYFMFRPIDDDSMVDTITILIVDENNTTIIEEEIKLDFEEGNKPSLLEILQDNFTVELDPVYQMIVKIGKGDKFIDVTNDNSFFIAIYYNDDFATQGASTHPYNDKDVFKFQKTSINV